MIIRYWEMAVGVKTGRAPCKEGGREGGREGEREGGGEGVRVRRMGRTKEH